MMKNRINKKKLFKSILMCIVLVMTAIGYYFINKQYSFKIPCIFHEITGLYCPGCGLTRMIFSILELDLYQAFRYNPFLFICLPLFVIYFSCQYLNWVYDKDNIKLPNWVWNSLLILTIIFMVLRNIPYFDFLKPIKL